MSDNVYPCVIYQRLRPSAPEASRLATESVWPLVDRVVEQRELTPCGLYGDSEFAPPFCGGSEIRPGLEAAFAHAKRIASNVGICTVLIGDAAPIGDGDPFLPAQLPRYSDHGVSVRVVNFHLRTHARSTALRSAWRFFELYREQLHRAASGQVLAINSTCSDVVVQIERIPDRWLARLYLANPTSRALCMEWKQVRRVAANATESGVGDWQEISVPPGRAAYLVTVLQGELSWARQIRIKGFIEGKRVIGSTHLNPADMTRNSVPFIWEALG